MSSSIIPTPEVLVLGFIRLHIIPFFADRVIPSELNAIVIAYYLKLISKYSKVQYRVKKTNEIFVLDEHYVPVRMLANGADVYTTSICQVVDRKNEDKKLAVKKYPHMYNFGSLVDARRLLREIKLLLHFNHEDIISLRDVTLTDSTSFDSFNDVYVVMPKMDATLEKVIEYYYYLNLREQHCQFFMYQMLRGLHYIHSVGIVHRNLTPENILINGADCDLKITGFGMAQRAGFQDPHEKISKLTECRWYLAPEVTLNDRIWDKCADIWSLGCIFAELLLRFPLFEGHRCDDQMRRIFEVLGTPKDLTWIGNLQAKQWIQEQKPGDGKPLKTVFPSASDESLQLLAQMLIVNPTQRASALQCLRHPYFEILHSKNREESERVCKPFTFDGEKSVESLVDARRMIHQLVTEFDNANEQRKIREARRSGANALP